LFGLPGAGFPSRHVLDDRVQRLTEMVGVGNGDIERIADDVDGSGRDLESHSRNAVIFHYRTVSLDEHGIGIDLRQGAVNGGAQAGYVLDRPLFRWPRVLQAIPIHVRLAEREIGESVDIVSLLWIAQKVVEEGPDPRVAGFRIGGEPDDLAHLALVPSALGKIKRKVAEPLHLRTMCTDNALDLLRRQDPSPLPGFPLTEERLRARAAFLEARPPLLFLQDTEGATSDHSFQAFAGRVQTEKPSDAGEGGVRFRQHVLVADEVQP